MKCLHIYPDDFTEQQLLELGIMFEARHTMYSNKSEREQTELIEARSSDLFKTVTDDEILTTACAFGIKEQVKNNQAIIKMVRTLIKKIIKRNELKE